MLSLSQLRIAYSPPSKYRPNRPGTPHPTTSQVPSSSSVLFSSDRWHPLPNFHSSSLQPELNPPSSKLSCFGRTKDNSFLDFRSSYLEVVIVFATRLPGRSPQSSLICGRNYLQTRNTELAALRQPCQYKQEYKSASTSKSRGTFERLSQSATFALLHLSHLLSEYKDECTAHICLVKVLICLHFYHQHWQKYKGAQMYRE